MKTFGKKIGHISTSEVENFSQVTVKGNKVRNTLASLQATHCNKIAEANIPNNTSIFFISKCQQCLINWFSDMIDYNDTRLWEMDGEYIHFVRNLGQSV